MPLTGLQHLPYEIMACIVQSLDVEDVFDLSLCSRHFQYLTRSERFCRPLITTKVPNTLEAKDAKRDGCYARALRRLVKRRRAVAKASPYTLSALGHANSYVYNRGIVCYILEKRPDRQLRILDLHGDTDHEVVVHIPRLISVCVPRAHTNPKYSFRVLYHACDITSCLLSFTSHDAARREHWLLVFRARESSVLTVHLLPSAACLFVRNDENYLYYGTHSEDGGDGFRRWALRGFNIHEKVWFEQKLHLPDMASYDMGKTACFEIIDDYFYGVSSHTLFEINEVENASFYHCFRFPVNQPHRTRLEVMAEDDSWRRSNSEGPIDDRWSFVKLEKDENSGNINIVEMRKEWQPANSHNIRTYYSTQVTFHGVSPSLAGSDEGSEMGDSDTRRSHDYAYDSDDIRPLFRRPEDCHAGDDSATTFQLRNNTHFLSYHRSSNAFLDLIQEDMPGGAKGQQRLLLRAGWRRPKPASSVSSDLLREAQSTTDQAALLYAPNEIVSWPPPETSSRSDHHGQRSDTVLGQVQRRMNPAKPKNSTGSISATGDERCILYLTESTRSSPGTLVYVAFDPAVKLTNMKRAILPRGDEIGEMGEGAGGVDVEMQEGAVVRYESMHNNLSTRDSGLSTPTPSSARSFDQTAANAPAHGRNHQQSRTNTNNFSSNPPASSQRSLSVLDRHDSWEDPGSYNDVEGLVWVRRERSMQWELPRALSFAEDAFVATGAT